MKILFKFPTRSRPVKFFKTLNEYYNKLSNSIDFEFLINIDTDDLSMNNETVINQLNKYPNLSLDIRANKTKIEAINAGLEDKTFDILVLLADDMIPIVQDFDKIIIEKFNKYFPNLDGVLWFFDGYVRHLNTLPILSKSYYDKFGCIYNPQYKSFWCDNEFQEVAEILKKQVFIDFCIIKHEHPAWNRNVIKDQLYRQNDFKSVGDKETYLKRKENGFYLPKSDSKNILWSILIPSLKKRQKQLDFIKNKLQNQIDFLGLQNQIEIITLVNEGEKTIGEYRNHLINMANGKYASFFDDDDDCPNNYIELNRNAISHSNVDCVNLIGEITFNGMNKRRFIHSISYDTYFIEKNVYYRPPNHLNVIKLEHIKQVMFRSMSHAEDTDFSMRMVKTGLLKKEAKINEPIYYYKYVSKK